MVQNLVDLHRPWFFVFVSVNFFHSFIPWSMACMIILAIYSN